MSKLNRKKAKLRVVVADDNKEMRDKVVQHLRNGYDVVGPAVDGVSACEVVSLLDPDIAILDISMPGKSGIEAARSIRQAAPKVKTIFLTVHDDPDFVRAALDAGVFGYVIKSQMASDLIPALTAVVDGKLFISPCCAMT